MPVGAARRRKQNSFAVLLSVDGASARTGLALAIALHFEAACICMPHAVLFTRAPLFTRALACLRACTGLPTRVFLACTAVPTRVFLVNFYSMLPLRAHASG